MIKKLMSYAGKYKLYAILSPVSIIFEVLIEVIIPLLMSVIIDCGISAQPLESKESFIAEILISLGFGNKVGTDLIISVGALMIVMACISLACGADFAPSLEKGSPLPPRASVGDGGTSSDLPHLPGKQF